MVKCWFKSITLVYLELLFLLKLINCRLTTNNKRQFGNNHMECTFLQYFPEILKRSLPNFEKILKKCSLVTI